MRSTNSKRLLVIGGGEVVRRLLEGGRVHPFRDDWEVVVATSRLLPRVRILANWVCPLGTRTFDQLLGSTLVMYMGITPDQNISYLRRLRSAGRQDQLVVIEKPICKFAQVDTIRRICVGSQVVVNDHWLLAPAVGALPYYLRWAKRHYGELIWINVALDETQTINRRNSAPFRPMGGVWGEYLFHALNLVRHVFPKLTVELETGRLFITRHTGAPGDLHTFAAFVGLAAGTGTLSATGQVALTISGGKGLAKDTKECEFIFEGGTLVYSHSAGQILIRPVGGRARDLLRHPANPFVSVFSRLIARDASAFQPMKDALTTLEQLTLIQKACRRTDMEWPTVVPIPLSYRVGTHPFPEWPNDAIITELANRQFLDWSTKIELRTKPAVRERLYRFLPANR